MAGGVVSGQGDGRLTALVEQVLGLGGRAAHHLGSLRVDDCPALVDAAIERRLKRVRRFFAAEERRYRERVGREWVKLYKDAERFSFYSYQEYVDVARAAARTGVPEPLFSSGPVATDAAASVFHRAFNRRRHTPDPDGYRRYLQDVVPAFAALLTKRAPVHLPERDLLRHAYVVATTESGKTELLKLLVHATLARDAAVVLLDPAGELAEQVARFREFAETDRLVYVDPFLAAGHTPTLNPLEVRRRFSDPDEELEVKAVIADQIVAAFEEMLAREPNALSTNMQAVLRPCLLLFLLHKPDATLEDLHRLLDDSRNAALVERGRQSRHEVVRDFFTHRFEDKHYVPTKRAIAAKLDSLLTLPVFKRLTCGPSTLDLERALAERKVIVVNLAEGRLTGPASEAFGRLLIATLQGIAFRRIDLPEPARVPVHLIVDEAHNFVTESLFTILGETRKFRVYAVLAQLAPGDRMSTARRDLLITTTKTKFLGQADGRARRDAAELAGVSPDEFPRLQDGEFFVATKGRPTFKFRTATHLLGRSNGMSDEAWHRVHAEQLARYYRPREPERTTPEPTGAPPEEARRGEAPAEHELRPARTLI